MIRQLNNPENKVNTSLHPFLSHIIVHVLIILLHKSLNIITKVYVLVFRAQEPKAPVTYCDHALSGVRRPSVCRPSVR